MMNNEIGSEFWDVPIAKQNNNLFDKNTHWFLSGRSALQAIIADNSFSSVSLPFWCCESMIRPFRDAGISVEFYFQFGTIQHITTDALLVLDYFGYTGHSVVKDYDGIIIRDTTHSLLSKVYDDADYYFGSLRKWAGFWTGGYAWGFKNTVICSLDDCGYTELREQAMNAKLTYLLNDGNGKEYLSIFSTAEEVLESVGIVSAAKRDVALSNKMDVEFIKKRRRENAAVLLDEFSSIAVFSEIGEEDCPMFVPIVVPSRERDKLRQHLILHKIYCPVHWPISEFHKLPEGEVEFYQSELSLVCDQRYNTSDMSRIVETVKDYFRGR